MPGTDRTITVVSHYFAPSSRSELSSGALKKEIKKIVRVPVLHRDAVRIHAQMKSEAPPVLWTLNVSSVSFCFKFITSIERLTSCQENNIFTADMLVPFWVRRS